MHVLLRGSQILIDALADLAHLVFERFEAEATERVEATLKSCLLGHTQCGQYQRSALLTPGVLLVTFAGKFAKFDARVLIGPLRLFDIGAGPVDLQGQAGQVSVAVPQFLQRRCDVLESLDRRGDINLLPSEVDQLVAGKSPIVVEVALAAQARNVPVTFGDALRQLLRFLSEQGELFPVVETQKPTTTVADRIAVVLLEPVAGMLDLPFARNSSFDIAQLLGFDALVVVALAKFAAQPRLEHTVAKLKLVQQRSR
ncbi:hypothetical protein D3C71_1143480 [compost metagenome]